MTKLGLRIDIDTFRGTRYGVPNLCRLLAEQGITASFFFSVGPDNMGRHLWRLIRPAFLRKMLRSKASSLYGWDILLKGTFWPGPKIGEKLSHVIRETSAAGHEMGLHAWDHHAWQYSIDTMERKAVRDTLSQGVNLMTRILGHPPTCSAAPAWKCNDIVLEEKTNFPFYYNSDCRGKSIFYPIVRGEHPANSVNSVNPVILSQPQIPVTLPTYDEVIGHNDISDQNYNDYLLSLFKPGRLNVLTVHAEVEGIARLGMFGQFLRMAKSRGISVVPLGTLLKDSPQIILSVMVPNEFPGREGWLACQKEVLGKR